MKNLTKYKKWIILLVIVVSLSTCAALFLFKDNIFKNINDTKNLQKVKVQAGWLLNGEFANVCTAINRGYYADEGLSVELIPGGPTGNNFVVATNALAQDSSIDIAIDGDIIPLLRGVAQNNEASRLKLKAFASFWNKNPYGFLVRKGSGIKSIKDFTKIKSDGTKVKLGLTADAVIQYAIIKYLNIDISELNIVKTGFDATPLITNEVDILGAYWTTQAYELEAANIGYDFISASEIPGFDQPSMVAIASQKTLNERPELLEKWLKATIKGSEAVIDNPELAAKEVVSNKCGGPLFNQKQELWLINKSLPLFNPPKIGNIDKNQITKFMQTYYNINQIERVPAFNEIVDMRILDKIY